MGVALFSALFAISAIPAFPFALFSSAALVKLPKSDVSTCVLDIHYARCRRK